MGVTKKTTATRRAARLAVIEIARAIELDATLVIHGDSSRHPMATPRHTSLLSAPHFGSITRVWNVFRRRRENNNRGLTRQKWMEYMDVTE